MRKEDLAELLCDIDENYIHEAENIKIDRKSPWRKWGAMAACFFLIAVITVIRSNRFGELPPAQILGAPIQSDLALSEDNGQTDGSDTIWMADFNAVARVIPIDAARNVILGYFTEELGIEELTAVVPEKIIAGRKCSGHAGFDGSGNLIDIYLTASTTIPGADVCIIISKSGVIRDYIMDTDQHISSLCGDVEYKAYQWEPVDGNTILAADAVIKGWSYAFTLETPTKDLTQAKLDLSQVLECFAHDTNDRPDLSSVEPKVIPEWCDKKLCHNEAVEDAAYGAYMLRELPAGFAEESIRRYKDQTSDYLLGLWTSGYDELRWKVYTFRDEDRGRLTDITDVENYDLSMYPIPRADSVPEELRAIVDDPIFAADQLTMEAVWARAYKIGETGDSLGWRMAFSVRYGDIIVEVRAKGVDPEWVYRQLMSLDMK